MPSERNDAPLVGFLALLGAAVVAYSLVIVQEILLGIVVVCLLAGLYVAWRFVRAVERIARSLEEIPAARGSEHD